MFKNMLYLVFFICFVLFYVCFVLKKNSMEFVNNDYCSLFKYILMICVNIYLE